MTSRSLPPVVLQKLQDEEPGAVFTGCLPVLRFSLERLYFVMIGSPCEVEQYVAEDQSLRAMYAAAPGFVPKMVASGMLAYNGSEASDGNGRPYLNM